MDDKELFDNAVADTPPETIVETPATPEATVDAGPARDEQGRFAPKADEPDAPSGQPTTEAATPQTPEANVPSWRLREISEAREADQRRYNEDRANWQRQFQAMQARIPAEPPAPRPDLYENPDGFVDHGVQQAVDPIRSQIGQLREFYSKRDAIREHGKEKVQAAYDAVEQGMARRDPEVFATYQRAMNSMDPFGDIVQWHQQKTVFSQIGSDPNAWFEKQTGERLKDPAYQAKVMQQIQQLQQSPNNPQGQKTIYQIPPSLNRIPSAHSASDDGDTDMSDGAVFRRATR